MVRGLYRHLRSTYQWGMDFSRTPYWALGTPGQGTFDFLPAPRRDYTALEIAAEGAWRGVRYRASYVLSRTWGNYPGLYSSDASYANPGMNTAQLFPEQAPNSSGLLPNDRTHVFKLSGHYQLTRDLSLGGSGVWLSGTPISEFGTLPDYATNIFLSKRGTVGRTPSIWDLNLRLAYLAAVAPGSRWRPKLTVDLLHVASQRKAVAVAQYHYLRAEYLESGQIQQVDPNPNYLKATAYQPPMEVRVGVEMQF
jgi:hypothetical protein